MKLAQSISLSLVNITVALVVALVLVFFSVDAGATPESSKSQLRSRLLESNQLPVGWSIQSVPGAGVGCLANLIEPKGIAITASSEIDFASSQGLPEVVERLATYRHTTRAFNTIVAHLTNCKKVKGEINGESLDGSLSSATFGHFGVSSATFAATFTGGGARLADDVAIVRRGNVILGIDEGGYDPLDPHQFASIVSAAAKKIA